MQLHLGFRNTVLVLALVVAGYYGYRTLFADLDDGDVAKLMRAHRRSEPARQAIIKHRIMTLYDSSRDYDTVVRSLDSASMVTQALAVEVLSEKVERRAVPKLREVLSDPGRAEMVVEAAAAAMGHLGIRDAIPRLVELTDKAEPPSVRAAAHNALERLTGAGAQVKLGDSTRQQWTDWLRTQGISPR